ncbi:MAG TPA: 50S ribosomal protein L29 [Candidatus Limnocylindrales bacterium]|nr:50S ribosomal protein L29 [Candidatus Limnocylindrales bacterium]
MDIAKVRELNDDELGNELIATRRHLYDLRFQLATRQLTDHSQLTQARRTIARVLTVMTERGIDENKIRPLPQPRRAATRGAATRGRGRSTSDKAPAKTTAARTAAKATDAKATASKATGGNDE